MLPFFFEFSAPFPSWFLCLLALGLGAGIFWINRRKNSDRRETALRFLAGAILFCGIGQLVFVEVQVAEPGLCVILDDSQSMRVSDTESGSRFESAQNLLAETVPLLKKENVSFVQLPLSELLNGAEATQAFSIPSSVSADSAAPDFSSSPLGSAIETALRTHFWSSDSSTHLAAVLFLTDGICTNGTLPEEAEVKADERSCALLPVIFGKESSVPQIYLSWQNPRSTVLCGEEISFKVRVFADALKSRRVHLRLTDARAAVLAETSALFSSDSGMMDLTLRWTPQTQGEQTLRLETVLDESVSETSSFAIHPPVSFSLNAAERLRRVLLVTDAPTWEFRNLRNLLRREPSIHLETWSPADSPLALTVGQDECARKDFPAEKELEEFDAVILNSVTPADLGQENLACLTRVFLQKEEIGRRRALILAAGRNFRPESWLRSDLASLFPISFSGMTSVQAPLPAGWPLTLTPAGMAAPQFQALIPAENSPEVSEPFSVSSSQDQPSVQVQTQPETPGLAVPMPPVFSCWKVPHTQPGAEILASANGFPVLISGRTGNVSTLFHAVESLWRWRKFSDSAYRKYWVQSIHALCQTEESGTELLPDASSEQGKKRSEPETEIPTFPLPESVPGQALEFARTAAQLNAFSRSLPPMDAEALAEEILLTLRSSAAAQEEPVEIRHPIWASRILWLFFCTILGVLWVQERKKR